MYKTSEPRQEHPPEELVQGEGQVMAFPDLYLFAAYLKITGKLTYVIDVGCSNPKLVSTLFKDCAYLGLAHKDAVEGAQANHPSGRFLAINPEEPIDLDPEILKHAVVIGCVDQRYGLDQAVYEQVRRLEPYVPYAFLSVSVSDLDPASARDFLTGNHKVQANRATVGLTRQNSRTTSKDAYFSLGGSHGSPAVPNTIQRVLAIVSCYNDEDFILHTVEHLLKEGVFMYFIDNWSDDTTYEILKLIQQAAPDRIVGVERFPSAGKEDFYNWEGILNRKESLSRELDFDWFIHYDSDEIRTSPWASLTLVQAISAIDSLGYNAIDHTVVDFRYSKDGFLARNQLNDFFTHFEFGSDASSFKQIKAWSKQPGPVKLFHDGGHKVVFPNRKVFPIKFVLGHYSLRSTSHARKKLFHDRLPRIAKEQQEKGWHLQYGRFAAYVDSQFSWDLKELNMYEEATFKQTYLCELMTGIGLPVKSQV